MKINSKKNTGFSLIEMAIVVVILGFLLGTLVIPLSEQREVEERRSTEQQLREIRNAIIGFVQLNGRLPCPAPLTGGGVESLPLPCTATSTRVPYATLGLSGNIINGVMVDAWLSPIIYRINLANFASTIPFVAPAAPYLTICDGGAPACALPNRQITNQAVVALISTGRDGPNTPLSTSPDQIANRGAGTLFVTRLPTEPMTNGTEFDDIVTWISYPELIYELSRVR